MWAHHRFLLFLTIHLLINIPSLFIISSSSSSSYVDRVGGINNDDDGIAAAAAATNELVDSICKQTSNYTFCVESIYTDPRAPKLKADDYFLLAYISFGLAYQNATDTLSYIKHEQSREEDYGMSMSNNTSSLQLVLQRCREDYEKAVSALEEAYNDLNSETYFDLKVLANSASQDALHCSNQLQQQQLQHTTSTSNYFKEVEAVVGGGKGGQRRRGNSVVVVLIRKRNSDLRSLCEICVVVSNQFSN